MAVIGIIVIFMVVERWVIYTHSKDIEDYFRAMDLTIGVSLILSVLIFIYLFT